MGAACLSTAAPLPPAWPPSRAKRPIGGRVGYMYEALHKARKAHARPTYGSVSKP